MKTGVELIAEEREAQLKKHKWAPEHDSRHTNQSLAMAAACYAAPEQIYVCVTKNTNSLTTVVFNDPFPWGYTQNGRSMMDSDTHVYYTTEEKKKNKSRIRQLQIAGALIAAEIDRIQTRIKK